MKKLLWALGKAALAVIVFLQLQTAVLIVYGVVASVIDPFHSLDEALLFVTTNEALSVVSLISGVLTIAALWLIWWLRGRSLWRQAQWGRLRPTSAVLSAVMGVGVCLLVTIAMGLIPWPQAWMDAYVENSAPLAENTWSVLSVLATVIAAPVVEELVFRGVVYTSLKSAMPRWLAAVLVSVVFGLLHGTIIWVLYAAALSFVMIFVYENAKSLWAPIALHMAFNLFGQMALMGEDPSFVAIVLVAAAGVVLTAVPGILLVAAAPQEESA